MFTASADMIILFDIVVNSIENLIKAGTPLVIGLSHLKTTALEVMFVAERLCGILAEPVREWDINSVC